MHLLFLVLFLKMFKKTNQSSTSISNTTVPKDTSSIAKVLEKLKGHNLNNGSVKFNPGENGLVFKYVMNLYLATLKRDSISFLVNPLSGSILHIMDAKVKLEITEYTRRINAGDANPGLNLNLLPIFAQYIQDEDEEVKPMTLTESKDDYVDRKFNAWKNEYQNRCYWEAYDAGFARNKHLANTTGPLNGRAAALAQVIANDVAQVHDAKYQRVPGQVTTLTFMADVPGLPLNLVNLNEEIFNSRINAIVLNYDKNKQEESSKRKGFEDEWDSLHA